MIVCSNGHQEIAYDEHFRDEDGFKRGCPLCAVLKPVKEFNSRELGGMQRTLQRLLKATKGCRASMHEPDQEGVTATVSKGCLDNAMGDDPKDGELVVTFHRHGKEPISVNLATILALARMAPLPEKEE